MVTSDFADSFGVLPYFTIAANEGYGNFTVIAARKTIETT